MSERADGMDDVGLSRRLTKAVREVDGVVDVFPAAPIVEAVAEQIAVRLALRVPDVLVDIDRRRGLSVTAHVAVSGARPATETVREVGERMRDLLAEGGSAPGQDGGALGPKVVVRVQLIDDDLG